MTFEEVLNQALAMLQRQGRVSYRALKRQFDLDDAYLDDLKVEIIEVHQVAVDQDGRMLVWTGDAGATPEPAPPSVPTGTPREQQDDRATQVASPSPEAERRQLTVMFCDLVDSTALSGQLDPEDLREVVRAYQATCTEVIQRFEGSIAQYLGDGLLVYFGYPQAHEDDAQRAVRAALGIIEAMETLNTRLEQAKNIRLAVRLGIHTGLVVVGEMGGGGRPEQLALGETPNVAARLQGLAAPDTVAISEATARLIQGYFACQGLGPHLLRGLAAPVQVSRVLGESGAQSRLEVASTRGLTPLVGREAELTLLLERWEHVKDGTGHVVFLSGEAGIGKSRLVQALKDHVTPEPHTRVEYRCSPYHQHSALAPVIHLLRREAAVAQERAEAQRALCTEHGFAVYLAWGTIEWGAALAAQGAWAEGLAQMRQGLAAYRVRGRLPWLLFLGLLAEGCGRAGQVEEGLHALHEALEAMQTTEERIYEAEVYRLRGELLLQRSAAQQGEAEESFQQALAIARHQQARSLELRAAMSLGRLWQRQGKTAQARPVLAEMYAWFTEGFDTADLQEAKALLEQWM